MCHGVDPRPPPLGLEVGEFQRNSEGALEKTVSGGALKVASAKKRSLTVSVNWGIRVSEEGDLIGLLKQLAEEASKRLVNSKLFSSRIGLRVG